MGKTVAVERTSFSTPQLLRLVRTVEGVEVGRQLLGYYHRTGLLRPTVRKGGSGRGCGHRWSLEDATLLLTIVALRKVGVPMSRIRRALAVVRQRMPEILAGGRDYLLAALIYVGGTPDVAPLTVTVSNLVNSLEQNWQLLTAAAFLSMALPMVVFAAF